MMYCIKVIDIVKSMDILLNIGVTTINDGRNDNLILVYEFDSQLDEIQKALRDLV